MINARSVTGSTSMRLYVVSVVMFVMVAVGAFSGELRMWGFNHLAYYSIPTRLLALGCIAAAFIPQVAVGMTRAVTFFLTRVRQRRIGLVVVLPLALAVLALVLFAKYRASTLLLGDGQLVANELRALVALDLSLQDGVARILSYERIAPLTSIVHFVAARTAAGIFAAEAVSGVVALYSLLGALLVLVVTRTLFSIGTPDDVAAWLALLLPSAGSVLLFCGYVEQYGLFLFFGALFVLSMYRRMHRTGSRRVPVLLWALATAAHIMGVLLLPAVVFFCVVTRSQAPDPSKLLRLSLLAIVAAAVGGRFIPGIGDYYSPLLSTESSVGVLSLVHIADIGNELMLLLPAFAAAVLVLIWHRNDGDRALMVEEWHLAILLLVPGMLFLLLFDAEIGMSRDWDLFVVLTLGMFPTVVLMLLRAGALQTLARPLAPLIVTGVILSTSWIGVNASPERSVARFRDTLRFDRSLAAYALETLARTLTDQARHDEALETMEEASREQWNPRRMVILGGMREQAGDLEGARAAFRAVTERSPEYSLAREKLVMMLVAGEAWSELARVAAEGTELFPERAFYFYYLSQALSGLGRDDEARAAMQQSELRRLRGRSP